MMTEALADLSHGVGARNREMDRFSHLTTRFIDPLSGPEWDRLVLTHPDCNFFHTAAWARVLCKTYGHKPVYLHFYRQRESVALIPIMEVASPFTGRRGVSMPFGDFCAPLVFDGWKQESLMEELLDLGRERNWRYFELRGGREIVSPSAVAVAKYNGHKLDLTLGSEKLFGRFHSRVRGAIRKAEKSGLVVDASKSREAMLDFYRLHVRTRSRHGIPPQPLSFFIRIHEEIIKTDYGIVIRARDGTRLVAAAVFFHSGKTAVYKFAASDERMWALRGNNLVLWEGIRQMIGKGLRTLHLGRTSMDNEGLRRFKLSWGTEEELIEYFRFDATTKNWTSGRRGTSGFYSKVFSRMPLALNRMIGALVYPHLD